MPHPSARYFLPFYLTGKKTLREARSAFCCSAAEERLSVIREKYGDMSVKSETKFHAQDS